MSSGASSGSLLALWLVVVQLAQAWLIFDYAPQAGEWFMNYGGTEALGENAAMVLAFADDVRGHSYVYVPAWFMLVFGLAWASFRGRSWSVRMAVAFLAMIQLAGVVAAYQVVEDERLHVADQ